MNTTEINLAEWNQALEVKSPEERLREIIEHYGDAIFLSTSFGIQSAVLLHMCTQIRPDIAVVWVDTGYLFPETYRFAESLKDRLALNLRVYTPKMSAAHQEAVFGKRWEDGKEGIEAYNRVNKVEPMNRAVVDLNAKAWITGLRRSQSSTREDLSILVQQNKVVKVHPIIDWSDRDIYNYLTKHDLPYHPLWEQGYVSVGDWHSTSKLADAESEEATRFGGLKRECGLHELSGQPDYQI
jgi:phosphoadenosine phosphosulfate reductase